MGLIPARLRNSKAYPLFQRLLRVLQFLSAVISLGVFSARLYKILRLTKRASAANGAVEGILVAAVAYTFIAMLLKFCLKRGGPKILRWVMILLDLLFVGAFIAVAYLTRPNGGSSGPCARKKYQPAPPKSLNCNLPWGTFILAIVSTILHALTTLFHEGRDKYNDHKNARSDGVDPMYNGNNKHNGNGHVYGHGHGTKVEDGY